MFCPECGTKADDKAAFCINCGSSLRRMPSSRPVSVTPASAVPGKTYAAPSPSSAPSYVPVYGSAAVEPGTVKVKTLEVHPAVSSTRYAVSSIPMFVLTFTFTIMTLLMTFMGTRFELILTELFYYFGTVTNTEITTEYMPVIAGVTGLVLLSQAYVMCAGLWVTVIGGLNTKGDRMNTAGLKMINVINKITFAEVIIGGAFLLLFIFDAYTKVTNNMFFRSYAENLLSILLVAVGLYIFTLVYFAKYIGTIKGTILTANGRRFCGETSMYVIVMSIFAASVMYMFSAAIAERQMLGVESFVLLYLSATNVLFIGIAFIRHRVVIDRAAKEAATASLLSGFIKH